MKKLSLIMLSLAMLFVLACSDSSPTGNTDGDTGGDNTSGTITLSGKITGTATSANILANTTSNNTFYYKDGNIIAVAVDNINKKIYQASTDANGGFSVDVPSGKNYLIIFLNSAGAFVGQLSNNGNKVKISPTSNSDFGNISFSSSSANFSNSKVNVKNTDVGHSTSLFGEITDNLLRISQFAENMEDGFYSYSIRHLDQDTWTHMISVRNNEYDENLGIIIRKRRSYEYSCNKNTTPSTNYKEWSYNGIGKYYYKDNKQINYGDFPQEVKQSDGSYKNVYEWQSPSSSDILNTTVKIGESLAGFKLLKILEITEGNKTQRVAVFDDDSHGKYRFYNENGSIGRAYKLNTDLSSLNSVNFIRKSICSKTDNIWEERPSWLTDDFVANLRTLTNDKLKFNP